MSGPGPWAVCDRCGFSIRHRACAKEWSGLFVCGPCRDPRPYFLDPPAINPREGAPVANARIDNTNYDFLGATEVSEDDL